MVLTGMVFTTSKVNAEVKYGFTITADKTSVKKDDIVTITIKNTEEISDINTESPYDYVIKFDKDVFEVLDIPDGSGADSNIFRSIDSYSYPGEIDTSNLYLNTDVSAIPANTIWGSFKLKVKTSLDVSTNVSISKLERGDFVSDDSGFSSIVYDEYISEFVDDVHCTITPYIESSDATLSNITLSSGTLDPTFSSDVTDYKVVVDNSIESLTVTPTATDSKASVTVNGKSPIEPVTLNNGSNRIPVVVTAEDGSTNTYTINAVRQWRPTVGSGLDIDELIVSDEITILENHIIAIENTKNEKTIHYTIYSNSEKYDEDTAFNVVFYGDGEMSYCVPEKNEVNIYINSKYTPTLDKVGLIGSDANLSSDVAVHTKSITVTITPEEGKEFKELPVVEATNGTVGEVTKVTNTRSVGDSYECVISDISGAPEITVTGKAIPITHSITITDGTVDKTEASKDETVTITPTVKAGYEVDKVTVLDVNNKEVTNALKDGKYEFAMPDSDVTINVTYKKTEVTPADPTGKPTTKDDGTKTDSTKTPTTGDTSDIGLWIALLVLAAGTTGTVVYRKKTHK